MEEIMPQIGSSGDIYNNTFLGSLGYGTSIWDKVTGAASGAMGAYNAWLPNAGANTANAAVTGLFSALSTLSGALSSNNVYKLYQQQEQLYIQNANEQARRIQLKGDIALRNLEILHATQQGKNELGAAIGGGRLSGSTLDVLVQNHKYNTMDERTSSLQTLWEVDNAKRQGYINAINVAGQAMTLAYKNRANSLAALSSFIRGMSQGLLADKRQAIEDQTGRDLLDLSAKYKNLYLQNYYGNKDMVLGEIVGGGGAVDSYSSGEQETGITSFLMDKSGIPYADPVTGINVHSNNTTTAFPLIQLNEDGSLKTDYDILKINNQ